MFARIEPRQQAAKYIRALMSHLPKRNGWTIAEWVGDRSPDATQRLLNRASWDTAGAMSAVRRFAVTRLDAAARPAFLTVGALDETGQEKKGTATAGVKRQHMGCAGGVDNGINTVHLAYVRAGTGHALIGARQWIPAEQICDPVKAITTGLPTNLAFATKGELAIGLLRDAYADGVRLDFVAGDEVYGACPHLRSFLEEHNQGYVLRVRSAFALALGAGTRLTCEQAVAKHLKQKRKWTIRSAGDGSKGERIYAWAWIATASLTHFLLVRKHRRTGELALHYCFIPAGQPTTLPRLIAAAGLRWPVEESFEFGKELFGLDQSQVRLYEAILRHTVLVMAALAICAVSAAAARRRTDTQASPPTKPDQAAPTDPGMIPLTVAAIKDLFNAATTHTTSLEHTAHWSLWRRRHQARARWFHQRARLATAYTQLSGGADEEWVWTSGIQEFIRRA
ncbi:IS701 family transposase [Nonomuraea sp. JJY05]|uniref:IS701 family transposase n=1 Tax=Nonomuraea sp. JJY05 TaxID=3350255 RepID=UPI00373E2473